MVHSMHMTRRKLPLHIYIDPDLYRRLDEWIAAQDVPPQRTAVVEAAIRAWLDSRERIKRDRK